MRIFPFPDCFTQFPWRESNLTSQISTVFQPTARFLMEIIERWPRNRSNCYDKPPFLPPSKSRQREKVSFNSWYDDVGTMVLVVASYLNDFRKLRYRDDKLRNLCNVHRIRTVRSFDHPKNVYLESLRRCSIIFVYI